MQLIVAMGGVVLTNEPSGLLLGSRTIITATGGSTYTTPTGCRAIFIECIGGGGGGGGGKTTAGGGSQGTGGSSGGYSCAMLNAPVPSYSVSVGTGGPGNTGNVGSSGNDTWFGSSSVASAVAYAQNGNGGNSPTAGTSELWTSGPTGAAVGSTNAKGDVTFNGNSGRASYRVSGTVGMGGTGAPGPFGAGGLAAVAQGNGGNGGTYGSGGGGGCTVNGGATTAGGNGGQGVIVVWEYY